MIVVVPMLATQRLDPVPRCGRCGRRGRSRPTFQPAHNIHRIQRGSDRIPPNLENIADIDDGTMGPFERGCGVDRPVCRTNTPGT